MAFITNTNKKSLGARLEELILKSEELKFLVGFFYFSGLQEIYECLKKLYDSNSLKEEMIKILIGLKVDEGINGLYEYSKIDKVYNQNRLKEEYYESLRRAFNSSDTDNKYIHEQVDFYIKLLEEKKLVLKKTKKPNHAKLYLFQLNDIITPNLFITGSSNLTRAGLLSQNEFNVEIKDYGYPEARKFFDSLWNDSINFSSQDVQKIIKILRDETFLKKVTPFIAWAYLLKLYIELYTGAKQDEKEFLTYLIEKSKYRAYNYQVEAILQALRMCESHGGVILADVVGFGKTVIACVIAKMLGKRGMVIAPPHLIGNENKEFGWKKYLEDFGLSNWEVRSLGKLDEALEFGKKAKDIEIIIVDEAHRFRNEKTERYHCLHEICRGKKVLLLTATPFNNRPADIFALLKLFTIPKKSTIILDENLKNRFDFYENQFKKLSYIKNNYSSEDFNKKKQVKKYYSDIFGDGELNIESVNRKVQNLARTIRGLIEPVVIRRNRLDLKYYGEEIAISKINDPQELFFELTKEQLKFYDEVISSFGDLNKGGKFSGAIYYPIRYLIESLLEEELEKLPREVNFMLQFQRNLYDFMRRLLVKRFESSFGAFEKSVKRFIEIHTKAIEFIHKTNKFILNRKLMSEILEADDDDVIEQKLIEYEEELKSGQLEKQYHIIYEIDKLRHKDKFLRDLENDKLLFECLLDRFLQLKLQKYDPKIETLINAINDFLNKGKIVIFTEYQDTAIYLDNILRRTFGSELLTVLGNISKSNLSAIYQNFDAQFEEQKDDYKILLATDKLSEGFNLNRAVVVINYDIPWNPVRVIQRVGRINRIAKKVYDEIFIVNFFPTEKGADIVKSREIAANKMFMIHKVLGEDAKIFSPEEEPQEANLYKKLTQYKDDDEESFFTKVRKEFENIKNKYPQIIDELKNIPFRIKVAKSSPNNELFVFIKKGEDIFIGYKDYNKQKAEIVSFDEIFEKVRVKDVDIPSLPLSDEFWEHYHQIAQEKEFIEHQRQVATDTANKAKNLLKSILNKDELKPYQSFISNLIDDIDYYGTLSEYVLSTIVDWEKFFKQDNIDKIAEQIKILRKEIGDDFLDKALKTSKGINETIIVAIENIKEPMNEGN